VLAAYLAAPGTKSSEKLLHSLRARYFRVSQPDSAQGMRIAATDGDLS